MYTEHLKKKQVESCSISSGILTWHSGNPQILDAAHIGVESRSKGKQSWNLFISLESCLDTQETPIYSEMDTAHIGVESHSKGKHRWNCSFCWHLERNLQWIPHTRILEMNHFLKGNTCKNSSSFACILILKLLPAMHTVHTYTYQVDSRFRRVRTRDTASLNLFEKHYAQYAG